MSGRSHNDGNECLAYIKELYGIFRRFFWLVAALREACFIAVGLAKSCRRLPSVGWEC